MKTICLTGILQFYALLIFSQTMWTNYNITTGLISNQVSYVVSDTSNNIWVAFGGGTYGDGIAKFDGSTWTHYDTSNSNIPQNAINIIKADRQGNVWMSFLGGIANTYLHGLTKFDGQQWTSYDTLNSDIISNAVWDVHFDEDNNLWIGCNGGISIFDGVDFDNYMIDYPNGIIGGSAMIVEDSANIWIGTFRGLIHYNLLTDSVILYDKTNSNIPSIYISDIEFDKNGIMWLSFDYDFQGGLGHGGTNGGLATFDGSNFTAIWPLIDPHTSVWSLVVDSSNNIWVSTHGEGLYRFNQSNWIQKQEVPITGISDCVNLDRENNIWYVDRYSGVWTNSPAVGINELNLHEQVKIFPNPATTKINIKGSDLSILSYKLYSVLGNEIKKLDGIRSNLLEISLEDVSAGVYFISLKTTKNEIITKRIVKR